MAEVLITLGIIGIVAAMTIPTLVNNYQKKILHTKFQKAYAVLNEVNTRMMADGIYQYNDFLTVIGSEEARIKQLDTFASYLNGATVCNDKYIICSGVKNQMLRNLKKITIH